MQCYKKPWNRTTTTYARVLHIENYAILLWAHAQYYFINFQAVKQLAIQLSWFHLDIAIIAQITILMDIQVFLLSLFN